MASHAELRADGQSNLLHEVSLAETKGQSVIVECYHDVEQCDGNCPRYARRNARRGCCSRILRTLAVIAGVSFLAVHLKLFNFHRHANHWNDYADLPNGGFSSESPNELPDFCKAASIPYKPGDLDFAFDHSADSASNSFYFDQHYIRNKNPVRRYYVPVFGDIKVQHAKSEDHDLAVDLDIQLTHDHLANLIHIKETKKGLTLDTELSPEKITERQPCIVVRATVSVSPSANLSSFDVDATALNTIFANGLKLQAENIKVKAVVGSIKSETSLDSRKIEIVTTSGSITGSYPLADLLSLKSTVGHIDVEIEPKEAASNKKDVAATLVINSKSGSVKTSLKSAPVPDREFKTSINTVSSSIHGDFPLGTSTTIEAVSGTVRSRVIPFGAQTNRTLTVGSRSGSVQVLVDDNQGEKGYALGTLKTKLSAVSGSLKAHFPAGWEGKIKAHSLTGTVLVGGPRLEIIEDKPVPGGGRNIEAVRGGGDSFVEAGTVTGSVSIKLA